METKQTNNPNSRPVQSASSNGKPKGYQRQKQYDDDYYYEEDVYYGKFYYKKAYVR